MRKYKLKHGTHTRYQNGSRVNLVAGDIFEPTEAEIKSFGDKLELVQDVVQNPQVPIGPPNSPPLDPDAPPKEPEGNTGDQADTELKELREKAKELDIPNAHKMGKERLLKEIADKEEELQKQKEEEIIQDEEQ